MLNCLVHNQTEKATAGEAGAKPRSSMKTKKSGCRSEVNLRYTRFFFLLSALILTVSVDAQQRPEPILVDEFGTSVRKGAMRPRVVAPRNATLSRIAFDVERATFDLMNKQRSSKGLSPLVWNDEVAEVARLHSTNMAERNFFSHRGQDGTMVDDRAGSFGINNWKAIGENIAFMRGYDKPEKMVIEKWLDSSSHRKNMLSPAWVESAIGVAVAPNGAYYFTQVFMVRL